MKWLENTSQVNILESAMKVKISYVRHGSSTLMTQKVNLLASESTTRSKHNCRLQSVHRHLINIELYRIDHQTIFACDSSTLIDWPKIDFDLTMKRHC